MFSVICIALYPLPAGQSLTSLIRIAALWSDGRLDIGDIDVAYREYIFQIWQDFGKHLSGDLQQGRYKQLENIRDELQALDERRHADYIAPAIKSVKAEFWRRESEL